MSVSDTFIHDNDNDTFSSTMPLMLYAKSLERLSEQKNVSPYLDNQGVLLIKKKAEHQVEHPIAVLSVEDYRVYAVEFPANITVNEQKYVVFSKPLGVLPERNFYNMEQYVSNKGTPLEHALWNVLKTSTDIGLSAQTLLKAVIAFTNEDFQSLLDDTHCSFEELKIPQNGVEFKRALNTAQQLPLTKRHFDAIGALSPEWGYLVDHWKDALHADKEQLNVVVQEALQSQQSSSFSM